MRITIEKPETFALLLARGDLKELNRAEYDRIWRESQVSDHTDFDSTADIYTIEAAEKLGLIKVEQ